MNLLQRGLLALLIVSGGTGCRAESGVELVTPETPADPVTVTGLSAGEMSRLAEVADGEWSSVLGVFVAGYGRVPAMLGNWELGESELRFHPRFPFISEQEYRVVFALGEIQLEDRFALKAFPPPVKVTVVRVYPTDDFLPENLLRFYVYFSASMQGGDVYRNIHLENAAGERIEQAFVETKPELWSPEMRRVTMILHPGRIKQGLEMSEREGPPLRQGEEFRLVVETGMRSASGDTLAGKFTKDFSVGKADRRSPDPTRWKIEGPSADSPEPIRIHLEEALDHALLPRLLSVEDEEGSVVVGTLTILRREKLCFYTPGQPWAPGNYELVVQSSLEDLAGNRVDMLFDRESTPPPSERGETRLPFSIHSGGQE